VNAARTRTAQASTGQDGRVAVANAARPRHKGRKARERYRWRETVAGYLFVAPSLAHLLVFVVGLMVASAVISTWRWDLLTPPEFVGLRNYADLMRDPLFWLAIRNTLFFVALTIPTGIALSLALALAVNTKLKGMVLFRSAYFVPYIVSMVAVAVVWRWVYNGDFGLLNWFLGIFGLHKVDWLNNPKTAMVAVAVMFVWKSLGWNMTLFLAGLQGIPQHLYEAASLDGAGSWQRFRHITWPLLTPTTFFVTVTTMIGNFQVFDAIYLMTQGGPGRSTEVYNYLLYNQAFVFFNMGTASAMAWILCAGLALLIFVQFRVLGRRVQYELG
jgi:multiple sugar transport system permease protein